MITPRPKIIAVGGGKGGIGKSFFSAHLGVALAERGYKVSLVDLDLGAANLHTWLGVKNPTVGLYDFISGKIANLQDVAVPTGTTNLSLLSGGQEFWQQIRPEMFQKTTLISKLQSMSCDYTILDLGAGTHVNTLDFFVFSHAGILVVVPESTSIENSYVFLKSVLYRKLQNVAKVLYKEGQADPLFKVMLNPKITVPFHTQLQIFAKESPTVGQKLLDIVQHTRIGIMMNQVRTPGDRELGTSMAQICKKYFGFDALVLGSTAYDDAVWQSMRQYRTPILSYLRNSEVLQNVNLVADFTIKSFLPT